MRTLTHEKTLNDGEKLNFVLNDVVYEYTVCKNCLSCAFHDNDIIFDLLDLDKTKFCTLHYGYKPDGGIFPKTWDYDFEALTRVYYALLDVINGVSSSDNYLIY